MHRTNGSNFARVAFPFDSGSSVGGEVQKQMGGTVKAWKQKASTWIKRALVIAGISIAVIVGAFLAWKAYVGSVKNSLRREIVKLEAQNQALPAAPSALELALSRSLAARFPT